MGWRRQKNKMEKKVNIEERYFENEEVRKNSNPYQAYYNCLKKTLNLNDTNGILDVGCATGWLNYFFKKEYPDKKNLGLEYFQYHKNNADQSIKDLIKICDLRNELNLNEKFDVVNCTETAEHIDPEYCDVFINNLKRHCAKYLIVSWSNAGGENDREHDAHLQHLNPMDFNQVRELLESHGLNHQKDLSKKMILHSEGDPNFHFWWRNSLSIWTI